MDLKALHTLVMAMADGYAFNTFTPEDDEFDRTMLLVENPKYDPINGEDPYLVLDLNEFKDFCKS